MGDRTTGKVVSRATDYARLLDDAYAALKAASKSQPGHRRPTATPRLKLANGKDARMDYFGTDPTARKAPTKSSLNTLKKQAGDHKLWLGPVSLPTSEGASFRLTQVRAGELDQGRVQADQVRQRRRRALVP